jgi:hypothetical protein
VDPALGLDGGGEFLEHPKRLPFESAVGDSQRGACYCGLRPCLDELKVQGTNHLPDFAIFRLVAGSVADIQASLIQQARQFITLGTTARAFAVASAGEGCQPERLRSAPMSRKSISTVSRKVRRISADAPSAEIVSSESLGNVAKSGSHVEDDEWPQADWQASSYALLSGCEVKDYTERIPDRVFDALFKD